MRTGLFLLDKQKCTQAMKTLQSKARWYVYELIDSRDGCVFYVGKGCGNRMHQHEIEAAKGVCSKKTNKINDIRASGAEVLKRQVAFFWDEQAAYDHETDHIECFGLENLTNILPGGQKAWERRVADRKEREIRPITPVEYAKLISKTNRIDEWFVRFAVASETGEGGVTVSGDKYAVEWLSVLWENIYPSAWKAIKSSKEALGIVAPMFKRQGVELVYGCA